MSDQLHRRLPSPGRYFGKKHGKICLYVQFYTFFNSLHVLNIATFRISGFCLFVLLLLLLFCIIYHQTLSTEQNQYIWNIAYLSPTSSNGVNYSFPLRLFVRMSVQLSTIFMRLRNNMNLADLLKNARSCYKS